MQPHSPPRTQHRLPRPGTAGVVLTLFIFMLLERRQLRDRVIRLVGRTHVALTTKALDEAGQRVARQLLMQTLVNLIYAVPLTACLVVMGKPPRRRRRAASPAETLSTAGANHVGTTLAQSRAYLAELARHANATAIGEAAAR